MTLKGLISRFGMLVGVIDIALRSLRLGVYVRPAKYRKYTPEFARLVIGRDQTKGLTLTEDEAYTLCSSVYAVSGLEGAMAEFGVYKGASARLLCDLKRDKKIYLFDTFRGMPNRKISIKDHWRKNTHRDTDIESVRKYLGNYSGVYYVEGEFPDSCANHPELEQARYSFVHLDVDLYESTLEGLNYFYPKMLPGGRLVSHNYNLKDTDGGDTPGVKEAFKDYFEDDFIRVVEIAETQCMIIKAANST